MSRFEGRTEKATPKKQKKARREGQNARSQEVGVALSLLGTLIVGRAFLPGSLEDMGQGMREILTVSGSEPSWTLVRSSFLDMLVAGLVPFLAVATVLAVAGGVMQTGFTLAPAALKPKLSHLDPRKGLERFKPGRMGWESLRELLKLGLLAVVVIDPIREGIERTGEASGFEWWLSFAGGQAWTILLRAALLAMTLAAADFAIARYRHGRQQKMTKQEVKQEHKDQEGDPHQKAARRRKAQEMSRNRMIFDVAQADVVIVNPTHFAVALKYKMGEPAPRVVAKGMGRLALKIRATAYRHGVLVQSDPPLARAIYRSSKLGGYVPSALFEAVAVVLATAYRRRRRSAA